MIPTTTLPIVGRQREQAFLETMLDRVGRSEGSLTVVSGPAGIGKTRLLRWVEETGRSRGCEVRWAYCLKDTNLPFFPFAQLFRAEAAGAEEPTPEPGPEDRNAPTVLFVQEEKPTLFFQRLLPIAQQHPTLLLTREREGVLRQRLPTLSPEAQVYWLSRAEGQGALSPTSLDSLGATLEKHLTTSPGSVVAIAGLEYLVSQNGFVPVLRLIQFLRDAAESSGGRLLVSLHPEALEKKEVALLVAEGEVLVPHGARAPDTAAPTESPAQSMLRFLRQLDGWSRRKPQILFFDDLQWADPESLRAVQFLARNIRTLPVLLVASLRPDDDRPASGTDAGALVEILDAMEREGSLRRLEVQPLDEKALGELCAAVLGAPPHLGPGEGSLSPLLERTGGNPYFLLELVRQMREEGTLAPDGSEFVFVRHRNDGTGAKSDLPDTLKRLVLRRLRMLTPEKRRALEMAAVAGSEFDEGDVSAALGPGHGTLKDVFVSLGTQHGLLDRVPGRPGRWSFGHPLVWEGTLSEIPETRIAADAATLARLAIDHASDQVDQIARLVHLAQDVREGPAWIRRAIDAAIRAHASRAVETYHGWLQDLLALGGVAPDARLQEGMDIALRLYLTGGPASSVRGLFHRMEEIPASPELRTLALAYRSYLTTPSTPVEAEATLRTAVDEGRARGTRLSALTESLIKGVEGNARYAKGDFQGSLVSFREASALAADSAPTWLRLRFCYDAGWLAGQLALEEEYHRWLEAGRALLGGEGTERMTALLCNLSSEVAVHRGDLKTAEQDIRQGSDLLRKIGDVSSYTSSLWNIAYVYELMGEDDRCRKATTEGRTLAQRFGLRFMDAFFELLEARLDLRTGHADRALEKARHALPDLRATSSAGPAGYAQLTLARIHLARGELAEAGAVLGQLTQPEQDLPPEDVSHYHRLRSELALLRGQREEARTEADLALASSRKYFAKVEEARSLDTLAAWELRFGSREEASRHREAADALYKTTGAVPMGRETT